jgi:hypothetical protein
LKLGVEDREGVVEGVRVALLLAVAQEEALSGALGGALLEPVREAAPLAAEDLLTQPLSCALGEGRGTWEALPD